MQQFHVIHRDGLEDGVVSFNSSLFFVYRKPTVTHSANITVLLLLLSKMVCRLLQSGVAYHMFIFILYWYCTFRLRSFSSITFIRCFDDKVLLSHTTCTTWSFIIYGTQQNGFILLELYIQIQYNLAMLYLKCLLLLN